MPEVNDMAWFYLIIAAIFEVGWPLGFKFSWFALMVFVGIVGLEITSK